MVDKKLPNPPEVLSDWVIKFGGEYAMWVCSWGGGGWDTGVGRSDSMKPNNKIHIENPRVVKAGRKNDLSKAAILLIFMYLQMNFC